MNPHRKTSVYWVHGKRWLHYRETFLSKFFLGLRGMFYDSSKNKKFCILISVKLLSLYERKKSLIWLKKLRDMVLYKHKSIEPFFD